MVNRHSSISSPFLSPWQRWMAMHCFDMRGDWLWMLFFEGEYFHIQVLYSKKQFILQEDVPILLRRRCWLYWNGSLQLKIRCECPFKSDLYITITSNSRSQILHKLHKVCLIALITLLIHLHLLDNALYQDMCGRASIFHIVKCVLVRPVHHLETLAHILFRHVQYLAQWGSYPYCCSLDL